MTLEMEFNSLPLGHEVKGVDLRDLDDATFEEIEATFDKYGVIVIRDQFLTPAEEVAFSRRFGRLDRFPYEQFNMPDQPEVIVLSNILQDGRPIGMNDAGRYWHSDMWVTDCPPRGSILFAQEVPHRDGEPLGDTHFASTTHAYSTLADDTKAKIEKLHATFSTLLYKKFVGHDQPRDVYIKEIIKASEQSVDTEITHPLVRAHPRTGEKCLFVVEGVIERIVEMNYEEGQALLSKLLAHITQPEHVYRHRWRVGDVVMWDNYSALHRATGGFELPLRRLMHRTTLSAAVTANALEMAV